jgi:hypothetical protein
MKMEQDMERTAKERELYDLIDGLFHPNRESMGSKWDKTESEYLNFIRSDEVFSEILNNKEFRYVKEELEYIKSDEFQLRESYQIRNIHELRALLNKIGTQNNFLVYRFTNLESNLERHGETTNIENRISGYIRDSKNPAIHPFFNDIFTALTLGDHLDNWERNYIKDTRLDFEFFDKYKVEIWVCDSEIEMHATELFNTMYHNRADNKIQTSLAVNNYFNKVYGNSVIRRAAISGMNDILDSLHQTLTRSEIEGRFGVITGETYPLALKQYILQTAKIEQSTDNNHLSLHDLSNLKREDVIWVDKVKLDNNVEYTIRLDYGFYNDEDSGRGFISSLWKNKEKFQYYGSTAQSISHISLTAIKEGQIRKINEDRYIIKFQYNGNTFGFLEFIIEIENQIYHTASIAEIVPYSTLQGQKIFNQALEL